MKHSQNAIDIIKSGDMIACHECDLLVEIPDLDNVKVVSCPRCNFTLTRFNESTLSRVFSFSVSALIFCIIANTYDFLSINMVAGTIGFAVIDSVHMLYSMGDYVFAALVLLMILVFPIMMLLLVIYLVWAVRYGLNLPGLVGAYKLFFFLKSWSMAEVFVIGALVSLIKIAGMAEVKLEIAFWAYIIFALLLSITVNSVDKLQIWKQIERLRHEHG